MGQNFDDYPGFQQTPGISEFMGKTFQAAQLTHGPLVCSTICYVQYYTPEVGGSSVWQISKKYFAGVTYGQKSLMSLKRFPHKFTTGMSILLQHSVY